MIDGLVEQRIGELLVEGFNNCLLMPQVSKNPGPQHNAEILPGRAYFCRLQLEDLIQMKMILIK